MNQIQSIQIVKNQKEVKYRVKKRIMENKYKKINEIQCNKDSYQLKYYIKRFIIYNNNYNN